MFFLSKKTMRITAILMCMAMLFSLCACGKSEVSENVIIEDDEPISICVSSIGHGKRYFPQLKELIKEKLGYDVEFKYQYSLDTTNSTALQFINNDLCADIMAMSMPVDNSWLEGSCLDYMSRTKISDYFTYATIKEYSNDDGALYQLPFNSKLIGITYNKTLLDELGCEEPQSYDDMLALKEICDEKGINFAVTANPNPENIAGYGFNWLFHLMGAQWLSTIEGTEWFNAYRKGEADVSAFNEQCQYFKEYFDAGLFGEIYTQNDVYDEYYKTRSLFYYELVNDLYRSTRLNPDGTIYGAEYESGEVTAVSNPSGDFIFDGKTYIPYDENNASHEGKERFDVPGACIDEFKSIPWISKDGSNNRYTRYDNMMVMLNAHLADEGNENRLKKAVEIVELMASPEARELFLKTCYDGYIAVNDFEPREDRAYSKYIDDITAGYVQPWYYTKVDTDTLVFTGIEANMYMIGKSSYDDVIDVFDESNTNYVNKKATIDVNVEKTFSCADLAYLEAVAGAQNLQKKLDENNIDEEVMVSIMPYTEVAGDMPPWTDQGLGIVSIKLYEGELDHAYLNTILPNKANAPCAVHLTGSEIKSIVSEKMDKSEELGYDSKYGPFPYALAVKGNAEIKDDEVYLVSVNEATVEDALFKSWLDNGKIIMNPSDEKTPITGVLKDGLLAYFEKNKSISPESIAW